MAKFKNELPLELMNQLNELEVNTHKMIDEMLILSADTVLERIDSNIDSSFEDSKLIKKGIYRTKPYKVENGNKHIQIAIDGYGTNKSGKRVPIPLVALAREYGTSRGEKKKPFFRRSFNSKAIESAMEKAQSKYIPED